MDMWKNLQQNKSPLLLGRVLTKYRTQHQLSCQDLAQKISVSFRLIEDLEASKYQNCGTYSEVESILKRLCYVFDLNIHRIIPIYLQEYRVLYGEKSLKYHQGIAFKKSSVWITDRTLRWIATAGVFMLLVGYIGSQVYVLARGPGITLDQSEVYQIVNQDQYTLAGTVEPGSQLTLNGEEVTLESDGRFELNLGLSPGPNHLELIVKRNDSKTQTIQKIVYRQ